MKGFLLAGTASGVGKTTTTLVLLAAMRRRGLIVQPFKGGPDFLDTSHHTRIAGRPARNLDTWMLTHEANLHVLAEASRGADAVLVEGMMGLFDGKDGLTDTGSSAEIARLLHLPVVLVLDASKSARSLAAVVLGFESFDPDLRLAGVILNRVGSERHLKMLSAAIAARCRTPVLGSLPREEAIKIPERHLGLHGAPETAVTPETLDLLAAIAEQHLNLDALLDLECGLDLKPFTNEDPFLNEKSPPEPNTATSKDPQFSTPGTATRQPPVRIGVARDAAFSFYYEDNLDLLKSAGAEIIPFSPLHDPTLPEYLDALYLGGGYPELHAPQLSANTSMRQQVKAFANSGRPIYAECGGMIYLAKHLTAADATIHPLTGVLDMAAEMTPKLVQFGYVTVELTRDCLLGPAGLTLRGHSFHYSRLTSPPNLPRSYRVLYSLSGRHEEEGYDSGNVLASYVHLHFRTHPTIALNFVNHARTARNSTPAQPATPNGNQQRPEPKGQRPETYQPGAKPQVNHP